MTDSLFRPIGGFSALHLPRHDKGAPTGALRRADGSGGAGLPGDDRARYAQPAAAGPGFCESRRPMAGPKGAGREAAGQERGPTRHAAAPPTGPAPEEGPVGPPPTFPINLLEAEARRRQQGETLMHGPALMDSPKSPIDPSAPPHGPAATADTAAAAADVTPDTARGGLPAAPADAPPPRAGPAAPSAFERTGPRPSAFPAPPGAGTLNRQV